MVSNDSSPTNPAEIPHVPVVFAYDHVYRRVNVTAVWRTSSGAWVITGQDLDRNMEYRTFRYDRIKGGNIRILED